MNKKLLTLAVASVVAGIAGIAQADVTVYGKATVSIDRENTAGFADNTTVSNNTSRLGFKFSDDLGGGLKAIGQYETAINLDGENNSGTGIIGGARNTFVGLSSDQMGTVLTGKHDTPFKIIGRAVELFPEYVGDARNITSVDNFDLRPNNVIAYATPNMGGFSALIATVTDSGAAGNSNATDNNQANGAFSANVAYSGGPLYVGVAYERHNAAVNDATGYRIAASGTFGMFKVVGLYQKVETGLAANPDRASYGIGAAANLSENHVIKAQYYKADELSNAPDTGGSMYAIAYDYKFSKKTTGYIAYAKTSNDSATNAFLVSNPAPDRSGHGEGLTPAVGNDVEATSIGLIVDF
jgi:predicted porin